MNKYILLLGVAGVALGSYCAYASNSATMTVTATIVHDVSLTLGESLSFGNLTINPSETSGGIAFRNPTEVDYGGGVMAVRDYHIGTFTANVPNPSQRTGLSVTDNNDMAGFVVGNLGIEHKSGNQFEVGGSIDYSSVPSEGEHSGTITISYSAQ
ncbi:MAG: hypothetical protein IJ689_04650 [Alphaproteobacteria bacterium]|nr:hypothetical protein [Alphaproteobacteria bacterium]